VPVEERNYKKENNKDLLILIASSMYLFIASYTFTSSKNISLKLSENLSYEERQRHGDGTCDFDNNAAIRTTILFSFIPTLILKTYGFIKYFKRDPDDFRKTFTRIEIFLHATFGFMTLLDLYHYMTISPNCREMPVMSMYNF
jgi:hypothetical protein